MRSHARGVDLDLELSFLQAPDVDLGYSFEPFQASLQHVLHEVVKLVLVPVGAQMKTKDRNIRALEATDLDPSQVVGQQVSDTVDPIPHLDRSQVHVGAVQETDAHASLACRRRRSQPVDPVDRSQNVLERPHDEPFHLLG